MTVSRRSQLFRRFGRLTACLFLLAGMILPARVQALEPLAALLGPPLAGAELDKVRGGFAGGMRLAFSLERQIYVNGNLESSTALFSFGPQIPPVFSPADVTTVLQNSLDYQQLQVLTLLEVRLSGFDPATASRFDALKNAQMFNFRR